MTLRHRVVSVLLLCAILACSLVLPGSHKLRAEETQAPASVCMANPSRGGSFMIPVPTARVSEMEGRGFVVATCNDTLADVANLHDNVCDLAARAPQPAKDGFAASYGLTPDELCQITMQILQGGAQ